MCYSNYKKNLYTFEQKLNINYGNKKDINNR